MNSQKSEVRGRLFGLLCTALLVFLWGIQPVFMRLALQEFDVYSVCWFRLFAASIVLGSLCFWRDFTGSVEQLKSKGLLITLGGVFLATNYLTFLKGIELGGALTATIMIQSGPLILALIGVLVYKERFSKIQLIAVFVALVGFAIFYMDRVNNSAEQQLQVSASLITVLAAILWVGYCIIQKQCGTKISPNIINLGVFISSSLIIFPLIDFSMFDRWYTVSFASVVYLSFSTLGAYWALGQALKLLPASLVSLLIVTNPFVTIASIELLSFLQISIITTYPLSIMGYVGTSLAVLGVGLATAKNQSRH